VAKHFIKIKDSRRVTIRRWQSPKGIKMISVALAARDYPVVPGDTVIVDDYGGVITFQLEHTSTHIDQAIEDLSEYHGSWREHEFAENRIARMEIMISKIVNLFKHYRDVTLTGTILHEETSEKDNARSSEEEKPTRDHGTTPPEAVED